MDTHEEIFRKEDGANRILFSFQNDSLPTAFPPVPVGPALSLGLNIGDLYDELDMPLNIDIESLEGGVAGSGIIYLDDPGTPLGPNDVVLKDGNAHHAVATYDSVTSEKAIYIDGVKRWAYVIGAPGTLITSGGEAAGFIGSSTGTEVFNGVIDEVAFWNRSLTPAEIAEHYANVLDGKNYFGQTPPGGEPGDTDGDGDVDITDLNNVRNNFSGTGLGDTDGDNDVDITDLNNVRNNFGAGPAANSVPEPSTWALLSISGLATFLFARRKNKRGVE